MSLRIETFVVGPLPNNLYLLIDDEAREAVVVDPSVGSEAALERMRELQKQGVKLAAIWNTHGHFDHIYDNAAWKSEFDVALGMHPADLFWTQRLREQALWFGLPTPESVAPDFGFEDGQIARVGTHAARVMHTPGHSPGSVSFLFQDQNVCISGDVLFRGSVGRTDLPGCSMEELNRSLKLLSELPAQTRILSGHGDATTISEEMKTNPFCRDLI